MEDGSVILVEDSSPLRAEADAYKKGKAIATGHKGGNDVSTPAGLNRMSKVMGQGSGQFYGRTNFSKSISPPDRSTEMERNLSSKSDAPRVDRMRLNDDASTSSSPRFNSAALNARSAKALPPLANSGNKSRTRSPSLELDSDSNKRSKIFNVKQFENTDTRYGSRPSAIVIEDTDTSSLSSAEPSLQKQKDKKKKRFRLGNSGVSSKQPSDEDDEVEMQQSTAPTSITAASSTYSPESIDKDVQNILRYFPKWEPDRVRRELVSNYESSGDSKRLEVMEKLKKVYLSPKSSASDSQTNGSSSTSRPQYLHKGAPRPPIGGVKLTSRPMKPLSNIVFQQQTNGSSSMIKKQSPPISKTVERVKNTTASARSSVTLSDADSDDDSDSDGGYDREKRDEKKALQWFNEVDEKQLMDVIGVTSEQANTILEFRPFRSTDDVTTKLGDKSAKGVTPKLFYNCVELMSGLQQVDGVLEKCEKMGNKLSKEVETWQNATTSEFKDEYYLRGQPKGLSKGVQLKDFQLHGVNWLNLLYRKECSGILADDMGLGKTAQVIAFLNVITLKRERSPHLIVVPSSVLTNWLREFATFGPQLRVFKYHGSQSERSEQRHILQYDRDDYDVVLTTYDMASGAEKDHKFLRKYDFNACIYDEGHILKNQKSIKYTKLLKIRAKWRLLLTGTPLQNNLGELISLLKFIMPSYFRGAEEALSQIFKVNQQSQLSQERVNRAKKMMQPFLLRRKKVNVLLDLKPKEEKIRYCDMTTEQGKIYKDANDRTKAALRQQQREAAEALLTTRSKTAAAANSTKTKSGHVLMELRKAANHPLLFRRLYTDAKIEALARDYLKNSEHADEDLNMKKEDFAINSDAELSISVAAQYKSCNKHMLDSKEWLNSGKITALKEVIDEAAALGERCIIFSQFVQTLEIICRALEVMGITYRGFTGSTSVDSRQEIVDEFTNDSRIQCFLLSTRAGGVGINLTAANWVILFDQDFNPQNDRQAADRAYRIGQEKKVTIVRLISKGTIDEHIYELGKSKLKLAERVEGAAVEDADEALEANSEEVETKVEQTLLAKLLEGDADDEQVEDAK